MNKIAQSFLGFQTSLKIYHWQTKSYARHKATDELFTSLNEKIDRFMETLQGSLGARISIADGSTIKLRNFTDTSIERLLEDFTEWLLQFDTILKNNQTDLKNIRDDILADVNKTLYLFTFS